jgi:hypothetical protein
MKIHICIAALIFVQTSVIVSAESHEWGWAIGGVGISYDTAQSALDADFNLLNMNILVANKINIGASIFSGQFTSTDKGRGYSAFFPLEVGFIPFQLTESYYLSLYGRGEWQFLRDSRSFWTLPVFSENNRLFGAVGVRLFLFMPSEKTHYSMHSSLFIEYTSTNKLRIGINLDISIFVAVITGVAIGISKGKYDDYLKDRQEDGYQN